MTRGSKRKPSGGTSENLAFRPCPRNPAGPNVNTFNFALRPARIRNWLRVASLYVVFNGGNVWM